MDIIIPIQIIQSLNVSYVFHVNVPQLYRSIPIIEPDVFSLTEIENLPLSFSISRTSAFFGEEMSKI